MQIPKIILIPFILFSFVVVSCSNRKEDLEEVKPVVSVVDSKESDLPWNHPQACVACHESSHEAWQHSHHAVANRRIDMSFENTPFAIDQIVDEAGTSFQFSQNEGGFVIEDLSLKGHALEDIAKSPVDSVIGITPIWQYLVPFPGGRLQTQALSWDAEKQEWFSVHGDDLRVPGDWGHWTGQGMNWNSNCAYCHMTDYKKNYDYRTDSYSSTWEIEAISCIQCHSGMEEHVELARKGAYVKPEKVFDANVAMESCATCHSRREVLTKNEFQVGDSFDEHFRMALPDLPGLYFENGLALEEDYVWTSFRLSKMGHAGVTCFDCHDPHTTKTKVPPTDNSLCMQCHSSGLKGASVIDESTHSHHSVGSTGAQCVECHMPERVYMGRDPRRDHGFTIPSPLSTIQRGEPNACTQCHEDQSAEWALEHFEKWWGDSERVKQLDDRADVLHRGHQFEADAWKDLIRLTNAENNPYWRSTYLRMLANYAGEDEALEVALKGLESENTMERDAAMMFLSRRQDQFENVQKGLEDSSRQVRTRAAEALQGMYDPKHTAFREWKEMAEMNSDRPAGALRLAEIAMREGDGPLARQLAVQAVNFDRNSAMLKYDASIILSRVGDLEGALGLLEAGRIQDPELAILAYAQGLLRAETGDINGGVESLRTAVSLDPTQERWWYNLAVSYYQLGRIGEAIQASEKALEIGPETPEYLQLIELSKVRLSE